MKFAPLVATAVFLSGASAGPASAASLVDDIVGAWASADGNLRIEFTADGKFVEDYNGRKAAYTGAYVVENESFTLNERTGIVVRGSRTDSELSLSGFSLTKQ